MPWVVGIDEAGYGPNLGPLVQACVSLFLPDEDVTGWITLKKLFRRSHEPNDGRLIVDDSKKVYSGTDGFEQLERTTIGLFGLMDETVGPFLNSYTFPDWVNEIETESWYQPEQAIPFTLAAADREQIRNTWIHYITTESSGMQSNWKRIVIPRHFNGRVSTSGSKATILADGIISFLSESIKLGKAGIRGYEDSPVLVTCDKLGGRNFYGPILQEAFPDGWPVAEVEGAAESRYRILNLGRDVTVSFKPRADGENVCVALASMLAKYVREVCMKQFNNFWAKHVPGIKPTAGYPVDAKRFYAEIRPAMERLSIPEDAVWRKK
jgi:hypothetical protein